MNALFLALVCLSAETAPLIVVNNVDQAANLPPHVERLRVLMRDRHDQETLAAVLKHAPNLRSLELYHPDNGVPLKSIKLLTKFRKLENLNFTGDANLDDDAFAALGKLDRLKSLRMKLPCPSFSDARLELLSGMTSLKKLDMSGCRGNHQEHERKVWEAIRKHRVELAKDLPKQGVTALRVAPPAEAPRPAEAPNETPAKKTVEQDTGLKCTLILRDGSHLVCTVPRETTIPLRTDFGRIQIRLKLVRAIQFDDDQKTIKTFLHDGDRLNGTLEVNKLAVRTSFGSISIPTAELVRYEASVAPIKMGPESETAAQIATKDAVPVSLKESDDKKGWRTVPGFLRDAKIFDHYVNPTSGIMDFEVTQKGVVYLACHFGYEGNSSGGWKERALTQEQFSERGWKPLAEMKAGNGRTFTIFRKPCAPGEHFRLRCNKYTPPIVILLASQE